MEDLVLSIPTSDYSIIEALIARMGWSVRTRRSSTCGFRSWLGEDYRY